MEVKLPKSLQPVSTLLKPMLTMTISRYKHCKCVIVCVMFVLPVDACAVLFILSNATMTCITLHLLSFLVKQRKPFVLYCHNTG